MHSRSLWGVKKNSRCLCWMPLFHRRWHHPMRGWVQYCVPLNSQGQGSGDQVALLRGACVMLVWKLGHAIRASQWGGHCRAIELVSTGAAVETKCKFFNTLRNTKLTAELRNRGVTWQWQERCRLSTSSAPKQAGTWAIFCCVFPSTALPNPPHHSCDVPSEGCFRVSTSWELTRI